MSTGKGIGGHHKAYRGATDDWLTPPEIIQALGRFDLDPCTPAAMPWATATRGYWLPDWDGLALAWQGRVWLNPPYGPETGTWLRKLADHGNGVALVFARTETEMFFEEVWRRATALLFLKGRLHFYTHEGKRAKHNAGGPSVLVAYGRDNAVSLVRSGLEGAFVPLGGM